MLKVMKMTIRMTIVSMMMRRKVIIISTKFMIFIIIIKRKRWGQPKTRILRRISQFSQ